MASTATGLKTCSLNVNLFSGARTALPPSAKAVLTIRDGNQQNIALPSNGFVTGSTVSIDGLPFFDNPADNYAVVASAPGYRQAGFFPVTLSPAAPATVDIMLLKKTDTFNFKNATWKRLAQNFPAYTALLRAGAADDSSAADRYGQLMENSSDALACFFNLVTAMSQIHLPQQTPNDYLVELLWDEMQQDRFFAWCKSELVDQVARAAVEGEFTPEVGTAMFHAGATRSWKQVQFGEANVQLTFHENDRKTINGVNCIKVEPDIDYYRDEGAHALLEVVTNKLTHSLTDPRQVYVLRWMAGRHAGVPNFEPPYTLE
jgi:hypothetical protein